MSKYLMPQDYIGRGVWFIHKGCLCKQKVVRVDAMYVDGLEKPLTTKLYLEHYGTIDPCRCFETKTEARRHRKKDIEGQLRAKKSELGYFAKELHDREAAVEELQKLLDKENSKCAKQS